MKRLDVLDSLTVDSPCAIPWSSMKGTDEVRFCGRCRKSVYNVAALPRNEAIALVERAEGRLCMRLTRRPDGTLVTGDCWAALRRARRRGLIAFALALPAIVLAQLWSQAFGLRALSGLFRRPPAPVAAPMIPVLPPVPPAPEPEHVVKGRAKKRARSAARFVTITAGGIRPPHAAVKVKHDDPLEGL